MTAAYQIKGIKNFKGHEGEPCSQGSMYLGAKKVCEWSDDSWGGPMRVRFTSAADEAAFVPFARTYLGGMPDILGNPYDFDKMGDAGITEEAVERLSHAAVEEALLVKLTKDHKLAITVPAKWKGGEPEIVSVNCLYTANEVARIRKEIPNMLEVINARFGEPLKLGTSAYFAAEAKMYKAKCKTQIMYIRLIGGEEQVWFSKAVYSLAAAAKLRAKYPDIVRIVNEWTGA